MLGVLGAGAAGAGALGRQVQGEAAARGRGARRQARQAGRRRSGRERQARRGRAGCWAWARGARGLGTWAGQDCALGAPDLIFKPVFDSVFFPESPNEHCSL